METARTYGSDWKSCSSNYLSVEWISWNKLLLTLNTKHGKPIWTLILKSTLKQRSTKYKVNVSIVKAKVQSRFRVHEEIRTKSTRIEIHLGIPALFVLGHVRNRGVYLYLCRSLRYRFIASTVDNFYSCMRRVKAQRTKLTAITWALAAFDLSSTATLSLTSR